jgi:hypothetical protein
MKAPGMLRPSEYCNDRSGLHTVFSDLLLLRKNIL